jgi:sn-glycerol 3-phosphate transport system substrate-binding protein
MYVSHFRFRSLLFPLSLFGSLLLFVIGCGAATPTAVAPATPAETNSSEPSPLILWHTFDDERAKTLEGLTNEFHKIYPDLTVTPVYVGSRDDLTKQMTAAVALGTAPDLVLADRRQIAEFASQRALLALDRFMDDAQIGLSKQDRADYFRGALTLGKIPAHGNRTYGFPFSQEAFVLFYNADEMKTLNVNRAPQDWQQFGEFAGLATAGEKYGWAMRADTAAFEAMLVSRGSALLTDDESHGLFNERAGINSLKLIAELSEGKAAQLAASDEQALREFASGHAAYLMGWMSERVAIQQMQRDEKKSFSLGVGILPQLDPTTPWLLVRGELFALTKTSPARERNAWFFVRWITSPTQSARWVRDTDALPLTASALNFVTPNASRSIFFNQIFKTFHAIPPRLAPQPAPLHVDTVEQVVSSLWLQAVQPKPDLRAILDAMVERVDQVLAVQP